MLHNDTRQRDFPTLAGRTYLNTAAEGIPPREVLDALAQYGRDKLLGMDGRVLHEAQRNRLRELTAEAYGLRPEEIGVCSCSSEAFNLAALALRLREGDEVVVNDLDFPAAVTPWMTPTCPAKLRLWRARQGVLRIDDLVALLGPKTRLVTTSLVSFYNGYRLPLPDVVGAVRRHSPALLAVDVTQALGRIPLELSGVDFIVSSTHKWILASHGGGLVGVPGASAEAWTVPAGGWFQLTDAFGPTRFDEINIKPGADSFSVGMPNYPAIYAVRAALEYNRRVGVEAIDAHARPLVDACFAGLQQFDVEMLTPDAPDDRAGIIAFRHPQAAMIHERLHAAGVHVMHHAGRLRVAIHGYNTALDIETLLRTLASVLH